MRYNENNGEELNGKTVIISNIDNNPIFETSCVVVGNILGENIKANYDLIVVGNVKADKIEIGGNFVCTEDCECGEIIVQGSCSITGNLNIVTGFFGESLKAKDICVEDLDSKGIILCSNLECNSMVICEGVVLIAEGLTGIGSLSSRTTLCGEYSMLNDTKNVFIADNMCDGGNYNNCEDENNMHDAVVWRQKAENMKTSEFYDELSGLARENDKYQEECQAFHKLMLVENIFELPSIKLYIDIMDILNKKYSYISFTKLFGKVKKKFEGFSVEDIEGVKIHGMSQKDFAKMIYVLAVKPEIFNDKIRKLLLEALFYYLGVDYENVLKKFEQNKEKKEVDNNVKKIKSISNEVLFEIGDKIEVISGVWKSTVGEVIKSDNKKKSLLIEVELLGGKRTVSILMKNCKRI